MIFTVDEAGSITGRARLVSYCDMMGADKLSFTVLLVVANITSFIGVVLSMYKLYKALHGAGIASMLGLSASFPRRSKTAHIGRVRQESADFSQTLPALCRSSGSALTPATCGALLGAYVVDG